MLKLTPSPRPALCLLLILTFSLSAWEPVHLEPYPQPCRTVHALTDAAAPPALHSNSFPRPVGNITTTTRATDGALWLGTTQGVMRLDVSAPERDRRQYFAGQ